MSTTQEELPPDQRIRKAEANDLTSVAEILGSAFSNDPLFRWFCEHGSSIYSQLFLAELQQLYQFHGHVFINESRTGAAMWLPPGISAEAPFSVRQLGLIFKMFRYGGFTSLRRGEQLQKMMAETHLQEPHYYLHAIGAHLDHQGRGIGSALLKAGVTICDEAGYPAYLESSNVRNNPLYERYGFEITGEIQLPENGPKAWLMKRPAG